MKKLFSFFAFVAIVLTFAACGGNDGNVPEVKGFTFEVQTLSTKEYIKITASDPNAYAYARGYSYDGETVDDFRKDTENFLRNGTFQQLLNEKEIFQGSKNFSSSGMIPDTKYVFWACRVEEDPETREARIVGDIEYVIYKTMPEYTLNGEFSVSDTRRVHFSQANVKKENSSADFTFFANQMGYYDSYSFPQKDQFKWEEISDLPSPWFVLSQQEWWYLFRGRNNAINRCAHARINGTNGLILLPDNWQAPDGIELHTDGELGFVWDEEGHWYVQPTDDYNGYEQNPISVGQWEKLELAGAVFLPAAGSSRALAEYYGHYWSNTSNTESKAYMFQFYFYDIDMSTLWDQPVNQSTYIPIRPVREVK